MEDGKLAEAVKELRKRKGLSQEELAKNSGLSLRTIQRVEKGETEPTGETIKRVSTILCVTPNELIDWESKKGQLKKTVKTKYEYLHIFDTKLVITKNVEIKDLVEDYGESVNNVFKTLMVFFIGIPIFTVLGVVFYNIEKNGLAIYSGSMAFCFLIVAFYTILFTSGSSLIKEEKITKIVIRKKGPYNVVVISHIESGRLKERGLILEKNQVDDMKDSLLSEKLIDKKNIMLKANKLSIHTFFMVLTVIVGLYVMMSKEGNQKFGYCFGFIMLFGNVMLLGKMILKLIHPLHNKVINR